MNSQYASSNFKVMKFAHHTAAVPLSPCTLWMGLENSIYGNNFNFKALNLQENSISWTEWKEEVEIDFIATVSFMCVCWMINFKFIDTWSEKFLNCLIFNKG